MVQVKFCCLVHIHGQLWKFSRFYVPAMFVDIDTAFWLKMTPNSSNFQVCVVFTHTQYFAHWELRNHSMKPIFGMNKLITFDVFVGGEGNQCNSCDRTVYPKKYAHGFVVLCFVVVMQSLIMNSHEVFIHVHQRCFAGTGAIVRLPQCQWSKPDGYGKISQCLTTTKHSKAVTVCVFFGIYCI